MPVPKNAKSVFWSAWAIFEIFYLKSVILFANALNRKSKGNSRQIAHFLRCFGVFGSIRISSKLDRTAFGILS